MTDYLVYDVFTETPFGGNQLAVFPDARALPEDRLQAITREFNFSEVTFVYPPENPAHTAKLRIFTPTVEVPFAGHPTIGTAVALAGLGYGPEMILELGVGPIACHATPEGARFTTQAPLEILAHPEIALVARALGCAPDAILTQTHVPVMAALGLAFTLTELDCRDTLTALAPDRSAFLEGAAAHPAGLDFAQFAYVREGDIVQARMFAPLDNIPEDPATGSACATLGALLAEIEAQDVTLRIHQGDTMGRPSVIGVTTLGPTIGRSVTISGGACKVMQGRLTV
ncbi:MAG: PhzF family phenazine biosynthesis protein [Pseudopelagicola sp.]|nr:PhzF family phenazine biosynthesis protein [Pseudopelagicola sp.]